MRKKERYEKILAWFRANRPIAETELHYDNPFELLIAVILSAQCTDKRVNMITPALYRDFPTPEALAATTPEVVYEYIRSVSSQQQSQTPCRHGQNAGERFQQPGARHIGETRKAARCGTKNGKRHPIGGFQ